MLLCSNLLHVGLFLMLCDASTNYNKLLGMILAIHVYLGLVPLPRTRESLQAFDEAVMQL